MSRLRVIVAIIVAGMISGGAWAAEPTLKWTYNVGSAINSSAAIQDIDGDGKQEVLIAGLAGTLHCVGADGKAKWVFQLPAGSEIRSSPSVGDLDGDPSGSRGDPSGSQRDGLPEILIGGSDGTLHCLRPNGELKWRVGLPNFIRRSACALADLDGDGKLEIVASGGQHDLFCLGPEGEPRWVIPTQKGTGAPPLCADVNGDGRIETLATCYDGLLRCMDPEGKIIWQFQSPDEIFSGPVAADVDGDGQAEVLVGSRAHYLYCLEGKTGQLRWSFDAGAIIDTGLSLEPTPEGVRIFCADQEGGLVRLDAAGQVVWRFKAGDGIASAAVVGDVDGDGRSDLVFGSEDNHIYMVSADTGLLEWKYAVPKPVPASAGLADLEGDGKIEFVIGDTGGTLYCFQGGPADPKAPPAWPLRRRTNDLYASLLPRHGRPAPVQPAKVEMAFYPPPVEEERPRGPVTVSVLQTTSPAAGAPLNLMAVAVSSEARPDCRMRLSVIHDGRAIYTVEERADLRPGSTVFTVYVPENVLAPGYYELSFDLTDKQGATVGGATLYLDKVTEARVHSQVEQAREQLAELDRLIAQAEAKRLDAAYPRVSQTVARAFSQYALDDAAHGKLARAGHVAQVAMESVDRGIGECNRLLAGKDARRPAPRFAPGEVRIAGGTFRAQGRPVALMGGMGWEQVQRDFDRFPAYGMNAVGFEIGPSATLASLTKVRTDWQAGVESIFAGARRNGLSVMWLLSPHYFPDWAYQQFPDVKTCGRGFLKYCILNPNARSVIAAHLRAVIPVLMKHPELNSYCLANEPVFDERCEYARVFFQRWLRRKYGSVARVNALWGTNYPSLGAIPFDKTAKNPAYRYDALRAHQAMGADSFRFMYDVIRSMDPKMPIHIKFMAGAFGVGDNAEGIDREALQRFCEINGCDAVEQYPGDAYVMGFPGQAMFYDLLRSFQPGEPVFNTEDHLIRDNDPTYYPAEYVRAAYWEAAMHGMAGSTIWLWDRSEGDSSTTNNILTRPECVEAMGRTCLDLNRLGSEVAAFTNQPTQAVILYSMASKLQVGGEAYLKALGQAYEGGYFGGVCARFISDDQVQAGGLARFKLLIVPEAANVEDATFRAIASWAKAGGLCLMTEGSLSADEHNRPRDAALVRALKAMRIPLPDTPQGWGEALLRLARERGLEIQQALDPQGKPIWGVVLRRSGDLVYLLNYNRQAATVALPAQRALDLVSGEEISFPFKLTPMRPVLVRLGRKSE